MKEGPDIALIGSLIGDPARANILTALMSGKALTATELAQEAGVTKQTASAHLKKLEAVDLIRQNKNGRHRYFAIADQDVADIIEAVSGLAAKRGLLRVQTGPKDEALRKARVCYNHLAGDLGVHMYDGMIARKIIIEQGDQVHLSPLGTAFVSHLGINITPLIQKKRPVCKSCLDWSSRRSHLAGSLGTAMLDRFFELQWATRQDKSRVVCCSKVGEQKFMQLFSV
jgi:DNA-binding transcriptional ArsR family regulator